MGKQVMTKLVIISLIGILFSCVVHATTSTAWYKVDDVKTILKLIDKKCIDSQDNPCQRTKHWRVYYKATSRYSPVQTLQRNVEANVPQVGVVMQMTVEVASKKKPL